jgi:BirA family biotin operon repressor/biotin-[acetyl-CoA-carboxylase] ligase
MIPPGWRLRVEEELPSTQDLVLRLAALDEPEGLALLARRQTNGRGREGRAWDSPEGNLHLSVLLRPGTSARDAPRLALLSAVALAEALAPFVQGQETIRLKWPNDLMLGTGKLAGVLCDTGTDAGGRIEWAVIGFGANLAFAPEVAGRRTACLARYGGAPSPELAAIELIRALERWRGQDIAAIRAAWTARGPRLGTAVTLRRGNGVVRGLYAGLAEDGSLLINTGAGRLTFRTGETGEG